MLLGERVHAGPRREVISVLRAAMQHHQQCAFALLELARNVEPVVSASRRAGKGPAQELSALRDLERLGGPRPRQCIETEAWKPAVSARLYQLANVLRPPRDFR